MLAEEEDLDWDSSDFGLEEGGWNWPDDEFSHLLVPKTPSLPHPLDPKGPEESFEEMEAALATSISVFEGQLLQEHLEEFRREREGESKRRRKGLLEEEEEELVLGLDIEFPEISQEDIYGSYATMEPDKFLEGLARIALEDLPSLEFAKGIVEAYFATPDVSRVQGVARLFLMKLEEREEDFDAEFADAILAKMASELSSKTGYYVAFFVALLTEKRAKAESVTLLPALLEVESGGDTMRALADRKFYVTNWMTASRPKELRNLHKDIRPSFCEDAIGKDQTYDVSATGDKFSVTVFVRYENETEEWTTTPGSIARSRMGDRESGKLEYARPVSFAKKEPKKGATNVRTVEFEKKITQGRVKGRIRELSGPFFLHNRPPFYLDPNAPFLRPDDSFLQSIAEFDMFGIPKEDWSENELDFQVVSAFARINVSRCRPNPEIRVS